MKEKYVGKVMVPFCVEFSTSDRSKLGSVLSEITGRNVDPSGIWDYYGITENQICRGFDNKKCFDNKNYFGHNVTTYTLEQLQAIIDEANKVEKVNNDGWIDWKGGDQPVSETTLVDVEFEDGSFDTDMAGCYCWQDSIVLNAIVAYRIANTPVASYSDDTATLAEDEYVDVGEDETVSNESVESNTIIKANISFDVTIKGQTFSLTEKELQDLYVQLCLAEGMLQDWRLGQ